MNLDKTLLLIAYFEVLTVVIFDVITVAVSKSGSEPFQIRTLRKDTFASSRWFSTLRKVLFKKIYIF